MTVCGVLLTSVSWGQVAPAGNSRTSPADSGDGATGLTVPASQPASNAPVITRVSPILPRCNQTIVIEGNGFGNSPPKVLPVGDAVDTDARNGQRPALAIRNHGRAPDDWQAGLARDGDVNGLGVKLESWTDTKITLAGFGDALGEEQSNATWKIAAGDPIEITVFGPAGSEPAKFTITVTTVPADDKTSATGARASGESENVKPQILLNQWFASLPALVVWTVGLVLAVKRWRERPHISILVAIACGVALLTLIFMPLAMQIGSRIEFAFVPPLLTLVRACLDALSIGLLLKAVFLERGKSELKAPEKPAQSGPAAITGPMGTALRISAGFARWTWRACSIVPFLFLGVFLLAGGIPKALMHPSEWGLDVIAATLGVLLVLAVVVLSWRWEWLGAIFFLIAGVPTLIGFCQGDRGELPECFISAISMLALLSWSLHTLNDANAKPILRRIAVILAPLLVIAIGFFVYRMPGARFNP